MQQLLPEVRSILYKIDNNGDIFLENPQENIEWDRFIHYVQEIDRKVDIEKLRLLNQIPSYMKGSVNDALNSKRNYDRALNASIGTIAIDMDPDQNIKTYLALELIDCSVLIIDDILDHAELRAKKPAHLHKWGVEITISTAMYMRNLASKMILDSEFNSETKDKILSEMENYQLKIYQGQFIDILYEQKKVTDISVEDYLNMISLTTGSQIGSSLCLGALLGNNSSTIVTALREIGWHIGMIGQIRDDLVDYLPYDEKIWKTPFLDFQTNKKRIPLLIGWANASNSEREVLLELQKKSELNTSDQNTVLTILMKPDNVEMIRDLMLTHKNEAINKINQYNINYNARSLLNTYLSYGMGEI